jgi:integrase
MDSKNPYISAEARKAAQALDEQSQRFNTQVAKGSDLDYFWGWAKIVHDEDEHYPVNWGLVFDFVATHLTGNFKPEHETALIQAGLKQSSGRHKASTVQRRLSTLRKKHKDEGHAGDGNPCSHPEVLKLLNDAKKTPTHATSPSKAAVQSIVEQVIKHMPNDTLGIRDKALFYVAFGAGGRRRSEVVQLKMEDVVERLDRFCIVEIRGAKNQTYADEVLTVKIEGKAKRYLDDWLRVSGITSGFIFRQLAPRSHAIKDKGISGTQLYRIVKKRFIESGVEGAEHFTPHSFRSGFVTEQGKRNKNIYDGMAATGHKSRAQYEQYYQAGAAQNNSATDIE